jgi:hypothetical protein
MLEAILRIFMVVGGAMAVLFIGACVALWWFWKRMKGAKPLPTGVRIWEGIPGSGKSYGVSERTISVIRHQRRPIYTNVPFKLRVLRKYLHRLGGDRMTKYIIPLDKEHFIRFIERFVAVAEYCEARGREGARWARAEAEWLEVNGAHVYRGPDANFIPYGAVLLVDEIHRWFDQRYQKEEDPRLLTLLTMHRHGQYLIECMSQNAMQVSLSFRRQCVEYIRCTDLRNRRFLGFIRFPLPTFSYEVIPSDSIANATQRTSAEPIDKWVRLPWLNGGLIWRLYNSFTHCGSARGLKKRLEEMRASIEGDDYDKDYERKRKMLKRHRVGIVTGVIKFAGAVCVVWFAFAWGRGVAVSAKENGGEVVGPVGPATKSAKLKGDRLAVTRPSGGRVSDRPVAAEPDAEANPAPVLTEAAEAESERPAITALMGAVGKDWAVINGKVYVPGERFEYLRMVGSSVKMGASLWRDDAGNGVVWSIGGAPVERLHGNKPANGVRDSGGDPDDGAGERRPGVTTRPADDAGGPVGTVDDANIVTRAATQEAAGAADYNDFGGIGRDDE